MAIDRKLPPGSVTPLSAEERWKQYRRDGGFGGESGGVQDDSAKSHEGGKGKAAAPKAKVGAATGGSAAGGSALSLAGGLAGAGTSGTPQVLPTSDASAVPGDLSQQTDLAAGSLPISNRTAVVAGSDDLKALSTPLSQAVDKLADHLAGGSVDAAALPQDIADYKSAMEAAGHGADAALGLKVMMDAGHLSAATAQQITDVAQQAGLDLSKVQDVTLEQAQTTLADHLADGAVDAGIVDLDVMQVKNLAGASGSTTTASDVIDSAVGKTDTGASSNLAALYAAAAKNGVDLSKDTDDKVGSVKNKSVSAKLDRDTKAANQKQMEASAAAAQQQQQQQQAASNSGGGGGTSGTGGGSGGGSTIQAPTYDKVAAATPYGAKEDLSKWTQQVYEKGKFNNEQEHYTDGGQNISYGADGSATITAKNEGNGNWSSARITGSPVGDLPAYLEATMQNPSGQGTWPAFWLVGPGSWPQGGEIDVMEQVNGSDELHVSNHWGATSPGAAGEMPQWSPSDTIKGIDMTQPHRYGVMITDSGTQFYLDGKKVGNPVTYPPEANFPKIASEMVPTLNLAMGGTWPGGVPNDLPDQTLKVLGMTRSNKAPDEG